jgi:hypothetical protein
MKPKKTKNPSMKQVAKAYRKTHSKSNVDYDGAMVFDSNGKRQSAQTVTKGKNTYKPRPTQITLGGERKGKGTTIKKKGRI